MTDQPPLRDKPVVILDTETTGLDENTHEILEISIIRPDTSILLDTKVRPIQIETAHPVALEVNGYVEEEWIDAPTWNEIAPKVKESLTDVVILGHNVSFDMRFVNTWLRRTDVGNEGVSYHTIDTTTFAYEHLAPCGLQRLNLDAVCDFLGIPNDGAHQSLADTKRTLLVYNKLVRATWLNRLWWRVLRSRRS